ncbi:MAG: response regulator [Gemmatimonadota bacterium]
MAGKTTDVEILLVEDDDADLELTLHALKQHRLANRIHVARDGEEALRFFENGGRVERLVLLDLKLPKVSGLQVLERLRADERYRTLPIVVLTSSREEPDIERCYALGVNSYIVKPVEFEKFSEAVGKVGLYWLLINEAPHRAQE